MKGVLLGLMAVASASAPGAGATTASVGEIALPTYMFSDPDPVPCTSEKRYPYFRYDGSALNAETQRWCCVTLENEHVRVTMMPQIGGKVWGAVDKTTGREFIYFNHVVKFRNIAMRGPWCSGGIEFNFGIIGHSPTTATPVDWCVRTNSDGSASYFASATEWINRTTWQVEVNLPPDAEHFITRTLWFNGANLPGPYYHWMTGAYSARGNPELHFSGTHYIGHEGDAHAWPIDESGRDLHTYANNAFGNSKSYHVINGNHSYFAVWWPEAKFGSYHESEEKFGRKIWIWALSRAGGIWEDLLTDIDGQYIELQSGRAFNQPRLNTYRTPFKHPTFAPGATDAFEEKWGVLRSREDALLASSPSNSVERPVSASVSFDWGSAYGRYVRGEQALRERDDRTGEQALNECLHKEPCFVPALTALAGLMARRGEYGRVRELCARALAVNTYDPEANYLDGIAADASGDALTARERLNLAAYAPTFRTSAFAHLAKMSLRDGCWRDADELAMKALRSNDRNLDAWLVRIVSARHSGDAVSARAHAKQILHEFPLFHGARFELVRLGDYDAEGFRSLVRNELPDQTYIELGTWYEDAGLIDEAKELFGYAASPVAKIRLAYILHREGRETDANMALDVAASSSMAFAFPFRRETLAPLRWAASAHASWKFRYLLAVQLAASANDAEADRLLDSCDDADEAVLFHYRALRRTGTARLADLLIARKISDGWRVGRDLATCHLEAGNADAALAITHEYLGRFPDCNPLEFLHARALCALGREEDAVAFLKGINVLPSEYGDNAHGIWQTAWEGIACKARASGDAAKEDEAMAHAREYPENLGSGKPYPDDVKPASSVCYTVPVEYQSGLWDVTVDGRPNGVASARTSDPPFEKNNYGGEYAFTSFEMDAPVKVTVHPKSVRDMRRVHILPASAPVTVRHLPDGALELEVTRPCRFSVEPDGRRNPLLVFANPPERNVPDKNNPKVKVFGPGVHRCGDKGYIELKDGETLYLKAGAFLKGGVYAHGKDIRICGRGVLDGSDWEWHKGPLDHVVQMWECRNVTVEDITIRGAYHWTVVPTKCDGVTVRNVKLCGGRVQNDDGINPCNSRNLLIEDCFIRTDDDCIAAKGINDEYGNCENVTVRNCVFWCDRARVVLLGHESRADYMRDFLFEDCDVIHFNMPVFLMEPGEEMRMENIRVKDFRINTAVPGRKYVIVSARPAVNKYMHRMVPGHISDCRFENVSVSGEMAECLFLLDGKDESHKLKNVTISNATLYGAPVMLGDKSCRIGAFTENVIIR